MAAPSYTTDLTSGVISTCESATDFDESSDSGWDDGGSMVAEQDYYIQGDYCISEALKTGVGTIIYDYGSGITFSSGDVFIAWHYCTGPSAMASYALGGMRMLIGSGLGDFDAWAVWGSEYYTYGGWVCIPVDPTIDYDYQAGTPSGTKQFFGSAFNITGNIQKGNTHGLDVMRYGRCKSIFQFGTSVNPCTFAGFASENDDGDNRWGLIQEVQGGYLWQGLMSIGTDSTAAEFVDSNTLVFVNQQLKVSSDFNKIEVRHADTNLDWGNIVFKSVGGVSRGDFESVADADIDMDGCSFIDMHDFIFDSNSTILNTNFIGCHEITQGGGTFTGCTIDGSDSTVAMNVDDISKVTNCSFVSGGSGYGIEGFNTAQSYTLTNILFSGYASSDGTTGDEMIHVLATSGTVTLNYTGTEPTVHSEGATIVKVGNAITVKVTAKTAAGVNIPNAIVMIQASDDAGPFPYQESVTIVNSGTTATVTHASHGLLSNDHVLIKGASHDQNNGTFQITKISDNSYSYTMPNAPGSSPTGTITSTFVALFGYTNGSGEISTSRVYTSDQNVSGRARKSSLTPLYKSSPIVTAVDSEDGLNFTAVMILDE